MNLREAADMPKIIAVGVAAVMLVILLTYWLL